MNGNANGMRVRVRSVVLGFIIGCSISTAAGVWWTYFSVVPGLSAEDARMRADLTRLEGRFANMVTRFDKLDAEEHTEAAHNSELTTEEKVSAALVTELTAHLHASDGRMDSHDVRMQQLQIELTRLRSDFDGLAAASGRRR